jgi:aminopeptidase YwaD
VSDNVAIAKIGPEQVKEAFAFTDEVVEGCPGRLAGSEACHKAAERIKAELERCCDAGTVKVDTCDIHPQALVKFVPVLAVLYYACITLLYFVPSLAWFSFAGLALGLFAFFGQVGMHWHLLDPLFPKKRGYNVYGCIEPSGDVKQQVILSGHHDAAYVFHVRERLPKLYAPLRKAGGVLLVIAVLVTLTAAIFNSIGVAFPQWVAPVFLVLGVIVLPFLFMTTSMASPGAGDDMMAVAIAAGTGKLFGDAKKAGSNPLKHTRLIILSFDAEECGLRGSHAWVKRHLAELKATKTFAFNMDPIYKSKFIEFYDADLSSRVKLSREMAQECVDIAVALGYNAYIAPPRKGSATDTANYGMAGIEATNFHGMSSKESDLAGWVYHTRRDVSKYIEPEVVEAALKITREYVLKKDAAV